MKYNLNKIVMELKPSGIRRFFDIAAENPEIISLTVGEPDFVTPKHICDVAIKAIEDRKTHYTSNIGMLELREEVANYVNRRFGAKYNPKSEIVITAGSSQALDSVCSVLINEGDEVIIPAPYYVCYVADVRLPGGVEVPIILDDKNKFKLTPEDLEKAITPKSKVLFLNYPNNPTGAIMTHEELAKLVPIIKKHNLLVLSDEIYSELTYGRKHASFLEFPEMRENLVYVSGLSKSHAMTGWRLGFVCGPEEIMDEVAKVHQFAIMGASTITQYAAVEALKNGDEDTAYMRDEYDKRRKYLLSRYDKMGLECFEPEGAFYSFPSIKKFGISSDEFVDRLIEEEKLAVVAGAAFGVAGEGHLRISYAYSIDRIKEGLDKLESFINKIK